MPKRPELTACRKDAIARLKAGEQMTWKKLIHLAKHASPSRTWPHDTLNRLHNQGCIRILRYVRSKAGPAMPVYIWADGKPDAVRPAPLTNGQKCKRWKARHPDKVRISTLRYVARRNMKKPLIKSVVSNFVQSVLHPAKRILNDWRDEPEDFECAA